MAPAKEDDLSLHPAPPHSLRGADSKCLEFRKIIAFFENPLLLFRLKEKISKAPSLVSQPWVGASSRLISLLSL
jgi:hypothetical protein